MKRHQGSIAWGIVSIVLSVLLFVFFLVMWILYPNIYSSPKTRFQFVIMIIIVPIALVSGIVLFVHGLADREVRKNGHPGRCVIESIHWVPGRHGGYRMTVSFKGDDGFINETVVKLSYSRGCELREGMVLECLIFEDRCYVNPWRINVICTDKNGEEF